MEAVVSAVLTAICILLFIYAAGYFISKDWKWPKRIPTWLETYNDDKK